MLHRDIADGVHRIGERFVNWYLIEESGRLTVVDASLPASWHSLLEALNGLGRTRGDIEALVLTHAHFDHIGFAERARVELGIPVWVHENDVPLTKRPWLYMSERSPLAYLGPKTLPVVSSFIRAGAPRVHRFGNEGSLDVPGSPLVLFTPGHTLGHCALHLPERDVVISGDALVTYDPYTATRGPGWSRGERRPTASGRLPRSNTWLARVSGRSCPATASLGQVAPSGLCKKHGV
jgi:glyoxylase-like metal-dependent hydrolase (beta-lactamase superfamily II)